MGACGYCLLTDAWQGPSPFSVVFQTNKENKNYRVVIRRLRLRISLTEAVKPANNNRFRPCWSSQNYKPPLLCVAPGFCAWASPTKLVWDINLYRIENRFPHFGCWCGEPAEPSTHTYQCSTHNNGRLLFRKTIAQ